MGAGRKTTTYVYDSVAGANGGGGFADTQRNLAHRLAGAIFGCTTHTEKECLEGKVFGLPRTHWCWVQYVAQGMPVFLFNYDTRELHGIFRAASDADWEINPKGWTKGESERTRYPAQVRVEQYEKCPALHEKMFRTLLPDSFIFDNNRHFSFELTDAEVKRLCDKFRQVSYMSRGGTSRPATSGGLTTSRAAAARPASATTSATGRQISTTAQATATSSVSAAAANGEDEWQTVTKKGKAAPVVNAWANKLQVSGAPATSTTPQNGISSTTAAPAPGAAANPKVAQSTHPVVQYKPDDTGWEEDQIVATGEWDNQERGYPDYEETADESGWGADAVPDPQDNAHEDSDPEPDAEAWGRTEEDVDQSQHASVPPSGAPSPLPPTTSPQPPPSSTSPIPSLQRPSPAPRSPVPNGVHPSTTAAPAVTQPQPSPELPPQLQQGPPQAAPPSGCPHQQAPPQAPPAAVYPPAAPSDLMAVWVPQQLPDGSITNILKYDPNALHPALGGLPHDAAQAVLGMFGRLWQTVAQLSADNLSMRHELAQYRMAQMGAPAVMPAVGPGYAVGPVMQAQQHQQLSVLEDVYLMGGNVKGEDGVTKWVADYDSYSPLQNKFKRRGEMPVVKGYCGAVTLGRSLFILGGGSGYNWLNSMHRYDVDSDTWNEVAAMTHVRGSLGAAAYGGLVYAIGGGIAYGGNQKPGQYYNHVELYRPDLDSWYMGPPMLTARFATSAAVLDNALYACGGFDGSLYLNSVERLDSRVGTWEMVAAMPRKRGSHSCVVLGNEILCVGGWESSPLAAVDAYDARANAWRTVGPMHQGRSYGAAAVVDGLLYALGGMMPVKDMQCNFSPTVEAYDHTKETWSLFEVPRDFTRNRSFMAHAVITRMQ